MVRNGATATSLQKHDKNAPLCAEEVRQHAVNLLLGRACQRNNVHEYSAQTNERVGRR
jgi:hypothetical protein